MRNLSLRFFITFFTSYLWIFVFVNFLGWSGLYPIMAIGGDWSGYWDSNGYFGFQSFLSMIDTYNTFVNDFEFASPIELYNTISRITSSLLGGLPRDISYIMDKIDTGWAFDFGDLIDILILLMQTFAAPLNVLANSLVLFAQVLIQVGGLLWVLMGAISGCFNVQGISTSELYPDISSILIGCI